MGNCCQSLALSQQDPSSISFGPKIEKVLNGSPSFQQKGSSDVQNQRKSKHRNQKKKEDTQQKNQDLLFKNGDIYQKNPDLQANPLLKHSSSSFSLSSSSSSSSSSLDLMQMELKLNDKGQQCEQHSYRGNTYQMEFQSISLIEQAQISHIPRSTNFEFDNQFSNNYFNSENFIFDSSDIDEKQMQFYLQNLDSAQANAQFINNSKIHDHVLEKGTQMVKQELLNSDVRIFRLPNTLKLKGELIVIFSSHCGQYKQDSNFLQDLFGINQKMMFSSKRRARVLSSAINQGSFSHLQMDGDKLILKKLKIVLNKAEDSVNILNLLNWVHNSICVLKLSVHLQVSSAMPLLCKLIHIFQDIQSFSLRIDILVVLSNDFVTAACSLRSLQKVKLTFSSIQFESSESKSTFFDKMFCPLITKVSPENFYSSPIANNRLNSREKQQFQKNTDKCVDLSIRSLKLSFLDTDPTEALEILTQVIISHPLQKFTLQMQILQQNAPHQLQIIYTFFKKIVPENYSFRQLNLQLSFIQIQTVHFTEFNTSIPVELIRFDNSEFSPLPTSPLNSQNTPGFKNTAGFDSFYQYCRNESLKSNLQPLSSTQANTTNTSPKNIFHSPSISSLNPMNSFTALPTKNYLSGILANLTKRQVRKVSVRDDLGQYNFNVVISQLRAVPNIMQLNLKFHLISDLQFQSLINLLQANSFSLKKLVLEIEKKTLISMYDDHKLFQAITKLHQLISLTISYKSKDPLFLQLFSAPSLVRYKELSTSSLTQKPPKITESYLNQLIKSLGASKFLTHVHSPDCTLSTLKNKQLLKDKLIYLFLLQIQKRRSLCYLAIDMNLKTFYSPSPSQNNSNNSFLVSPQISQNQFLLDLSLFY